MLNRRPEAHETAVYYHQYIAQVEGDDIVQILSTQEGQALDFWKKVPAEKWDYRYAEGKWTVKELLLHIIDTERIFAYRALRIARQDQTPIPGFEQDDYVPASKAGGRTAASLIEEYATVRAASLSLLRNLETEVWSEMGTASGHPTSVLGIAYIMAGHELHHQRIMEERYL